MRIPLIKIGNSKGIRIPSALIKKCGFTQEVDIDVKNQTLVLSSPKEGREKWITALQNEKEKILLQATKRSGSDETFCRLYAKNRKGYSSVFGRISR